MGDLGLFGTSSAYRFVRIPAANVIWWVAERLWNFAQWLVA